MTDLFDENKPKDEGNASDDNQNAASSVDTYLGLITNDDGSQKYATAEEALKGSVHAQSHISTLETELKELRENAEKNKSMDDIIAAIENKKDDKSGSSQNQGVSPEQLTEAVGKLLDDRESVASRKENVTTVTSVFRNLYGEKASETMYSKANDLGFNKDEINSMIATNPNAALKVLGVDVTKQKSNDPVMGSGSNLAENFSSKEDPKPQTIMGSTNSKDLTEAWKLSQAATLKRLGVELS